MTKHLLRIASAIEMATGVALMFVPTVVVRLLLAGDLSGVSVPVGRVAGLGLLSLGIACWPGRESGERDSTALTAMLVYNALVAAYLVVLGIRGFWVGPLLWPAAVAHCVLLVLLAGTALRKK